VSDSSWWSADPVSKSSGASASNWWSSDPVKSAKAPANVAPDQGMSWGDVGKGAIENLPNSALRFGEDVAQPFIHPIDTATGVKNIGEGVLEKTGMISGTEHEKYADAIGKFFKDRYGSMDAIKHTLATDPVGVAADLSTFLTGGEMGAERASSLLGKTTQIADEAGIASRIPDAVEEGGKIAASSVDPEMIDTRGEGMMFHGSADPNVTANSGQYSSLNYYGQGFYTTDAADVAWGYSKKGAKQSGSRNLYEVTEDKPIKLYDAEVPMDPALLTQLHGVVEEAGEHSTMAELLGTALEENPKNLRELYDEVRDYGTNVGESADTIQETYNNLNSILRQFGYDGITHVGGLKTGVNSHKVNIYFKPEDTLTVQKIPREALMKPSAPEASVLKKDLSQQGALDKVAARIPSMLTRAGAVAGSAGRAVDPLRAAGKVAKGVGRVASETIGGIGTHTGGESLRLAARSGYEGGAAGKTFRENMRGSASMEDVVADARGAVKQMRQQRGSAYRQGMMAHVASDPTVLNFSKIDQAVQDAGGIKKYKGQSISPSTEAIHAKMEEVVDEWKNLDPKEFHTVEGLDALKQKLGDVRDATQYGTPERLAADRIYQAVRKTITEQAPEYARVMRGYERASTQIKEIERALSLNQNASVDTALRKLQSVLRDNVNSNYGNRKVLADYLVHAGAPHLMEALAGQALKPWTARGLGKLGWQLAAELGLASAAPHAAIGVAAGLPFMSPRVMGEAAHAGGRLARRVPEGTGRAAFQVGRESQFGNDDDVKIIPDGP
jgi:hypothetical protein